MSPGAGGIAFGWHPPANHRKEPPHMNDHNLTACLGKQAEDKITGIRGTITMLAQYVAGTPRVMLEAAAQDGSLRELWLDIDRVRIIDETTA
jgi:hypothetical protein